MGRFSSFKLFFTDDRQDAQLLDERVRRLDDGVHCAGDTRGHGEPLRFPPPPGRLADFDQSQGSGQSLCQEGRRAGACGTACCSHLSPFREQSPPPPLSLSVSYGSHGIGRPFVTRRIDRPSSTSSCTPTCAPEFTWNTKQLYVYVVAGVRHGDVAAQRDGALEQDHRGS